MLRPTDEQCLHVRRVTGKLDGPEPRHQFREERAGFEPRQVGTEAVVRAEAERDMVVRVARDVEESAFRKTSSSRLADGYDSSTDSPR